MSIDSLQSIKNFSVETMHRRDYPLFAGVKNEILFSGLYYLPDTGSELKFRSNLRVWTPFPTVYVLQRKRFWLPAVIDSTVT